MSGNRLPKSGRVHGRNAINELFTKGKRFTEYPFRVVWIKRSAADGPPLRFGISVSRRISKLAVVRNRIKRQCREAYRLSCHEAIDFLSARNKRIDFFLVYTGKSSTRTEDVREKINLILKRLIQANEHSG